MNGYGKKGGIGPTKGRKATNYTAVAPDGTVVKTKSFFVSNRDAQVAIVRADDGRWLVLDVRRLDDGWENSPAEGVPGRVVVQCVAAPKAGFRFLHRHYLAADCKAPAEFEVTAVRRGFVYYRPVDGGAPLCCPIEDFYTRYVK
jgi:hypothetical protein